VVNGGCSTSISNHHTMVKEPITVKLPRSSSQKVALQYLWQKKWYLPASTVSVTSSAIISATKNMYIWWNTLFTQNWQEKVNLTIPRWIAMLTKLDKWPMHWCEEVNTGGIRAITRQTRNIWWSCRYGILSTPQISPTADRMTRPTETHTVEINGAKQLWIRAHKYKWQHTIARVAMHKRDASTGSTNRHKIANTAAAR
jgi:hypothetical protein